MGFRGQAKPAEETLAYASGRPANTRAGASPIGLSVLADRRVQAHLGHRRNAMIKYYACLGAAVIFLAPECASSPRQREAGLVPRLDLMRPMFRSLYRLARI